MGFFNNIFGSSDESNKETSKNTTSAINWNNLQDLGQLENVVADSQEKTTVIFKHSTRCSISRMALKQFENEYNLGDSVSLYFLDLISHRDVSNEIANKFGVQHQSPQMIAIKNGKVIFTASHSDIEASKLESLV
jgi:bacillithiol system protein YtxJ